MMKKILNHKLIDNLTGSISLPKKFKKMSTEELINFAKSKHFSQKHKLLKKAISH